MGYTRGMNQEWRQLEYAKPAPDGSSIEFVTRYIEPLNEADIVALPWEKRLDKATRIAEEKFSYLAHTRLPLQEGETLREGTLRLGGLCEEWKIRQEEVVYLRSRLEGLEESHKGELKAIRNDERGKKHKNEKNQSRE